MQNSSVLKNIEENQPDCNGPGLCLHCGDPVVKRTDKFCCSGCSSVYEIIHNFGLENFYSLKKTYAPGVTSALLKNSVKQHFNYLNLPEFKKLYVDNGSSRTMKFYIEGIHCSACLWIIEKIPEISEYVESVDLNMSDSVATVTFRDEENFDSFPETVSNLGYKPHPLRSDIDAENLKNKENRTSIYRIGVGAVCTGNIMLLSAAIYSGARGIYETGFEYIILLLSIPVVTYCALPFYRSVWRSLKVRKATVDIPIVFVVAIGFLLSTVNLFSNGEVYFDSIAAFVFLLLASRHALKLFQERVRKSGISGNFINEEDKVLKWNSGSKQYFLSPVSTLKRGDRIKLEKGRKIPVDGTLRSGSAALNLSVLTGESMPQTVMKGGDIFAGSFLESEAVIEVDETGSNTRIGKILKYTEEKSLSKNSFSSFSDRYSTVFTLLVAAVSLSFFVIYTTYFSMGEGFERTISLVLISCPCAFVFALPLNYAFALRSGARKGFVVKDLNVFEKLGALKNVYLDKTGTLTRGNFRILRWDLDSLAESEKAAILAVQQKSGHPVALTMISYLAGTDTVIPRVDEFKHLHAVGFTGRVGDDVYEFISTDIHGDNSDLAKIITTSVDIYKNKRLISNVLLGDELREDAKYVIDSLKDMRFRPFIISGDSRKNVARVAEHLDIPEEMTLGILTPEEKISIVGSDGNSMMVGDGLNDSGALAEAGIGVAIRGGVEESLEACDVYLLDNRLVGILELIKHGKLTSDVVKLTIIFSVTYNVTAGVLAMMGFISPLAAAVLMPLSSAVLTGIGYIGSLKMAEVKG